MNKDFEQEIDLGTLFKILLRKWYFIVLFVLLGVGLAGFYAYQYLPNEYTAQSTVIVLVSNEANSNEQNFNFSQKLTKTYTELAKSDLVLNEVISNLSLDLTLKKLRETMSITGVDQTPIIKLSVKNNEPLLAQQIANETIKVMQEAIFDFEGFDDIELIDLAPYPNNPSGPNRVLIVAIGLLLGGVLGVVVVLLNEFLDKTIKTPEDLELKLNLRMLSVIPHYEIKEEKNYGKKKSK